MLLSIIVTLYNRRDIVVRAIESVLDISKYDDIEVVVVDDGSNDRPLDLLSKYIDDTNIKYFYKENGGAADAKNYGASVAKGEFIIFLDSDDYLFNVEALVDFVKSKKDKNYDFFYSKKVIVKKGNVCREDIIQDSGNLGKNIYDYMLEFPLNYPGKPTYIFKREVFNYSKGFTKEFKWGDAMLFWRIFLKDIRCCEIDFPTYVYDQSANDSISRNRSHTYYHNVLNTLSVTYLEIESELESHSYKMNWVLILWMLSLRRFDLKSSFGYFLYIVKNPINAINSSLYILRKRKK
ncbi:glycosyltransferase family 2 protein [Hafnia alvei]|uniref:GalNac(5)-diNacbac-PP-undecaprenol beta-1,3-glucosyltransferase n=1 Tax=Hafnia alvei TaxID=569 RepID=A0A172WZW1_HAFAL|nr:glycosyltransferase family 2 protein [Hafnia alvei]ANF29901.1 galNac(5)-diNacbac-PP-undecaprenol beta-1,3-glucosyltransferase [Hafnia alvei]TBL83571.1 glycosyltransferase family 2 protein [Hafnia alvei]